MKSIRTILLGLACFLVSSLASAFPVEVQMVSRVPLGKHPRLILNIVEPAKQGLIKLKREDGRQFTFRLGNLQAGTVKEINLDGHAGRHTYEGTVTALVDGESVSSPLSFSTFVAKPLTISVDRASVDLNKRVLRLTTSRAIDHYTLKIVGLDDIVLSEKTKMVTTAPGAPILVTWEPLVQTDIVRLEIKVEDTDGFFSAIALTPWSVQIPHEEVLFASASASIEDSERSKLDDSLGKVKDALKRFKQIRGVQLFIAGHTDTVGGAGYNLGLSRKRARAIAAWFVAHKVPIHVSYEGFGESSLKIKTKNEVDEPKNRRVDYILSVEPPTLTSNAHHWRRLN